MHVLRSPHSRKSFSGWLTIAQLTGAPLRYHQQQSQLIGDNKPLFPHPPPYQCHQSPSSHNSIQNIQQDNQVAILADRIIIFSTLCVFQSSCSNLFYSADSCCCANSLCTSILLLPCAHTWRSLRLRSILFVCSPCWACSFKNIQNYLYTPCSSFIVLDLRVFQPKKPLAWKDPSQ